MDLGLEIDDLIAIEDALAPAVLPDKHFAVIEDDLSDERLIVFITTADTTGGIRSFCSESMAFPETADSLYELCVRHKPVDLGTFDAYAYRPENIRYLYALIEHCAAQNPLTTVRAIEALKRHCSKDAAPTLEQTRMAMQFAVEEEDRLAKRWLIAFAEIEATVSAIH